MTKSDISSVLIRPHITEKATMSSESSVYVFEISQRTTKQEVAKAFNLKYKKEPTKIAIVRIPAKKVFVRGKKGVKSGYKKAYVYLKKGEKVEIV